MPPPGPLCKNLPPHKTLQSHVENEWSIHYRSSRAGRVCQLRLYLCDLMWTSDHQSTPGIPGT